MEKINFQFWYAILDQGTTGSTSSMEQEYRSSLGLSCGFSVGISVGFEMGLRDGISVSVEARLTERHLYTPFSKTLGYKMYMH